MPNISIRPSQPEAAKIVTEITGKIDNYEKRMTNRLARWVEAAELYSGKTATTRENSKISCNSAELYKAIRAISNMMVRMMVGQKPSFELEAMDIIGAEDPHKLLIAEHYITQQLDLANYNKNLVRALVQLLLYGTVVCHEPYEPVRRSFLGKKKFVTQFRPISLINCAFSLDAYDVEESKWVAISDIQSKSELDKLLNYDPEGKVYNTTAINAAKAQGEYCPNVNTWVTQRLAWQGYINQRFEGGMERITYYGPLDSKNSDTEYCVEVVNRQFIVRMEEYEGMRPVRIATINTIDVEPLGNGLHDVFHPVLQEIDDAKSALLNMVTLAGANMFAKQKSLTDEDIEFTIRQFGVMSLENPDMKSIGPNPNNIQMVAGFLDNRTQAFRQGSGATDTLQAIVSNETATATATSLSMNESVRNVSVMAECAAPILHRDHIKVILEQAQKYNTEPFTVNVGGLPVTATPNSLLIDVNVRVKTATDQDFRPAKLQRLGEGIKLGAMVGPALMQYGKKYNPAPAILEYFKTLDVPRWQESIQDLSDEDRLNMLLQAQMAQGGENEGTGRDEKEDAEERVANEVPGRKERRQLNRDMGMPMNTEPVPTPVGPVLGAPGDIEQSSKTIRQASVK